MTLEQLTALSQQLKAANAAYRSGSGDLMPDAEYDALERTLVSHATALGRTDLLVFMDDDAGFDGDFNTTVNLSMTMDSQDKALNLDEMAPFYRRTAQQADIPLCWSDKLDGLSVELTYHSGVLAQAVTRGDGAEGTDITANVALVKGVKPRIALNAIGLPSDSIVYIRGEITLDKVNFDAVNALRDSAKMAPFTNTRQGASGIVRAARNRFLCHLLNFRAFDIKVKE